MRLRGWETSANPLRDMLLVTFSRSECVLSPPASVRIRRPCQLVRMIRETSRVGPEGWVGSGNCRSFVGANSDGTIVVRPAGV